MRVIKPIAFLLIVLFLSTTCEAEVRRICKVQYETEDGWNEGYTIEVTFITGRELNKSTKSYNYEPYSNYCLIWFSQGEVAILKITDYISPVGEDFDSEDFRNAFRITSELDCEQVNSESKRNWKITAKNWTKFIDARES